jgi:hypothetical protein
MSEELETQFQSLVPSEEVTFELILGKWDEFTAQAEAGPCHLTPEEYSLQIAISRHLIDLVSGAVSEETRKVVSDRIAKTDEAFKAATRSLAKPLAEEEATPPWYLLRGPKAVTAEACPELWDFYFGNPSGLTAEQLAELDAATKTVCEDDLATFSEILQYWKEFVVNVERGYDNLPDEYAMSLWQGRGNLEQIRLEISEELATALDTILDPWDLRFAKATRESEHEEIEGEEEEESPDILRRVPVRFRLRDEDLSEWDEIA